MLFSIFFALFVSEYFLYCINKNGKCALDTLEYSKNIVNDSTTNLLTSDEEKTTLFIPHTNINFDFNDKFYKNGFRYTKGNKNSKESYVFLGCSYTYGDALNHNETLPYYFSKLMNFQKNILNCGVCSRGSNTALNILNSNIIEKTIPDTIVKHFFYILIDDHVERNFRLFATYANDIWIYKNGNWNIPFSPFIKVRLFFAKSYIFRNSFEILINNKNKNFYKHYLLYTIKEMKKIIKEKYHSKLTVVIFPGNIKKCESDFLLLPEYFNNYKAFDGQHPSAKAQEKIATLLYNHINNQ
ncbi:MAG: hypothetical protein PHI20_03085 [Endomicrobiaceae bacterium]|jgi:hypothetical protein|nr:hypothetical protein [Endomicrobiaceae bacterium]MDD3730001.1 hypothetical protein [Endomicrobiaceae bacterium]MDD4166151.1 hypothetical protein [Endomicrobiaceae bacterium]